MKFQKTAKKYFSMMLITAMVVSLAACGKDVDSNKDSNADKPTGEEQTGDPESKGADASGEIESDSSANSGDGVGQPDPYGAYPETVTMEIGKFFGITVEFPDGRSREDNAIRDYVKEKLNLEYNFTWDIMGGEDYQRQQSLAIVSEELPDVMAITDRNVLDELVENDLIADLTEVYHQYAGKHMREVYDTYSYPILERVTYDGKMMALPRCAPEMGTLVWIRQDWLDALNLTIDQDNNKIISRDELKMVAQKFLEEDPGSSGKPVGLAINTNIGGGASQSMNAVNDSFGAYPGLWFEAEDGTVYNGFTSPQMKEALGWWADMFQEGILDPQFGVRTQEDVVALLVNNQSGITFAEWTNPAWQFSSVKEMNPEAEFTAYCLDNGEGGVNMVTTDSSCIWFVVRKDYEHPEALIKLANLLAEVLPNTENMKEELPEIYTYMQTSVYDQSQPLTDFRSADYFAFYGCDEVKAYFDGKRALEDIANATTIVMIDAQKIMETNPTDPAAWGAVVAYDVGIATLDSLDEQGLIQWIVPLRLGTTETMNSKQADLSKIEQETIVKIITGDIPVEELDSYVEEWNSRGGAQIAEELADKLK